MIFKVCKEVERNKETQVSWNMDNILNLLPADEDNS